jgi:hydroxymethylbilane synthase
MTNLKIRIGSRSSRLAITQTSEVISLIKDRHPEFEVELVTVKTEGDVDRSSALVDMGGYGLFTKAIEQELLNGRIDAAVHSAKDLPSRMTSGLTIAAVPHRESCCDALVSADGTRLMDLGQNAVVGTGSPRRRAQIMNIRQDISIKNIRGNVETRLRKLREGVYDAIILAHAGLKRSGCSEEITELLDPGTFVPAAGQGALAVQALVDDLRTQDLLRSIDHTESHRCLNIERLLLEKLNAGCSAAVGALARLVGNMVRLDAVVLDKDGTTRLCVSHETVLEGRDSELVDTVVERLFEQGAEKLITG